MKDLGLIKKILGIEIKRNRRTSILNLSEKSYMLKLFEKFAMFDFKNIG